MTRVCENDPSLFLVNSTSFLLHRSFCQILSFVQSSVHVGGVVVRHEVLAGAVHVRFAVEVVEHEQCTLVPEHACQQEVALEQ